jgi:MarR family transcriptional regulator, organic hydroperoxide resistance regulator
VAVRTDTDFIAAWEGFTRAVRRARGRAGGALAGSGLTIAQYQLIEPLRGGGAQTVSELAAGAGVAAPTATRMLDALVRDGLVTRRGAEHDRRAVLIGLTRAGRDAVERAGTKVEEARARVRDQLTAREQEEAAALLRRLAAVVEEQL